MVQCSPEQGILNRYPVQAQCERRFQENHFESCVLSSIGLQFPLRLVDGAFQLPIKSEGRTMIYNCI